MSKLRTFVIWLVFAVLAFAVLFPFAWLFLVSLNAEGSIVGFPPKFMPHPATFANYAYILETMPVGRFLVNSAIIVFAGVMLDLLFASMAGYALARLNFRGKEIAFGLIIATLLLPGHASLIVNFVTMVKLGLVDTYAAVWLPSAVTVLGIFLMRQAFLVVPKDLEDAARVDGASEWIIFWRVMLPLVKAPLAALAIIDFTALWNSFLWPLIVLKSPEKYPLSLGLLYLQGLFAHKSLAIAAGAVLTALPTLLLFLFGQRYFVKGTLQGAIK